MVSVNTIQSGTVFAWFMLMMLIRRLAIIIIGVIAGRNRAFPPGSRVPEDKMFRKGQAQTSTPETPNIEFTKDVRANKTITNDTENDTYFLILLLAIAVFSDWQSDNSIRTIVYGTIYLSIRILYAVAYIMGLQPWRSLIFLLGFACTLACNLDLVITMSRRRN